MKQLNKYMILILSCLFLIVNLSASADDTIPENGAKYIVKSFTYDIDNGSFVGKVYFKKIIYNKLGEKYNSVYFFENNFTKVKDVKLQVLSESGEVLFKKDKKHFNKACGYGAFGGYTDNCTYYYDAEAPQFPYVVELAYTIECKSLFFLNGNSFQEFIPVDSVSFTINSLDKTNIYTKLYNSNVEPEIFEFDGTISHWWILTDLPALKSIKYLPAGARDEIHLKVVCEQLKLDNYTLPEVSWSGIGQWYNLLYKDKCDAFHTMISQSIEDIYTNVIDSIRYVAIEIGVGGWQPYDASLTESRAFGDCKDMSTLLVSRLRNQKYEAYPVLVLTRDIGRIDRDFPSLNFNHVITVVIEGTDTTWMDPTCNSCAYGELPYADEDIDVLVVTDDGGVLQKTPPSTPENNKTVRTTSLMISADQKITISSRSIISGNRGRYLRNRLIGKADYQKKEILYEYINGNESNFKLISFSFENLDDINEPFIMHLQASANKKVDKIGKKWYLNPYLFFREKDITKVETKNRNFPIKFNYPQKIIDTISIQIDTAIPIDSIQLIKADTILTSFNFITTETKELNGLLYCVVQKESKEYQIEPDKFEEYNYYYERLRKLTSKFIKLYTH